MINDNDVMAFIYAPFPGRSPVNSVAFLNDTRHFPLDYFVTVDGPFMQHVYIENFGPHMYPEISMDDKSHNCCPSPVNTTSWPVQHLSPAGKW